MANGNILVLTYWPYNDALIQTYTLPYLRIIRSIVPADRKLWLVTQEKKNIRIDHQGLAAEGIELKPLTYTPFGLKAIWSWLVNVFSLCYFIRSNKVEYIHCWCTPAGAIGYVLSVLTGKRLVIDSYEPHAESMVENGTWKKNSFAFKLLLLFEKLQSKRAWRIVATTAGMNGYAQRTYGLTLPNLFVKPACVNLDVFSLQVIKNQELLQQLGLKDKIVCVYAGKFGGIYLKKEVFDFFKVAQERWRNRFRVLLLTSHSREEVRGLCGESGVDFSIISMKFVKHEEVPKYMGLADFAITPVKPVPSKRYCTPIKNGEYWALGLPIVISSGISDDSAIIEDLQVGAVVKGFSKDDFQSAIDKLEILLQQPNDKVRLKIRSVAEKYRNFEIARKVYQSIYGNT